ncbi:hypothetical protein [Baekduia soli]|uniref:hypothetical protein n=1 Tax=Baekduia soli TaxID=496014 RepID=UPI001651F5E4|nr:hypothetical protein [Baekduia soli]
MEALHADEEFVAEARWFDGSILIEAGAQRLWLKVYRGRVIEVFDFIPVFGYTFKLSGSPEAWTMLGTGERTFTDLVSAGSRYLDTVEEIEAAGGGYRPPEIAIEGNGIEAGRMHIASMRLAGCLARTAVGAEAIA